jgi:uncharacterized membrane protein HdeD (DUF308 family)
MINNILTHIVYLIFLFVFFAGVIKSVSYLFRNLDDGKRAVIMIGVVALVYFIGAILLGGFPQ